MPILPLFFDLPAGLPDRPGFHACGGGLRGVCDPAKRDQRYVKLTMGVDRRGLDTLAVMRMHSASTNSPAARSIVMPAYLRP